MISYVFEMLKVDEGGRERERGKKMLEVGILGHMGDKSPASASAAANG